MSNEPPSELNPLVGRGPTSTPSWMGTEPPTSLSKGSERAVNVVFDACRLTGTSLATCHRVAAMVAEELERIEAKREH